MSAMTPANADGGRDDSRALEAVIDALGAATTPLTGRGIKDALRDSDHGRDTVNLALRAGDRTGRLHVEDGPRRSRVYSSVRVSGSVLMDTRTLAAESVSRVSGRL